MCCFSKPIRAVGATRIFARAEGPRQLVVYETSVDADGELAMVLPIPTRAGASDADIEFVDLTSSPTFFAGLEHAYPQPKMRGLPRQQQRLAVHVVGSFEASFVPTADDFDRVDRRFAIPRSVWSRAPAVAGFGFVVFKLAASKSSLRAFHPMAFWFPRRDLDRLYFPTLHIHDGTVRARADFDHALYAQSDTPVEGWERSSASFQDGVAGKGRSLVLASPGRRRRIHGSHANEDTWIPA
jgi:hypothetical protein